MVGYFAAAKGGFLRTGVENSLDTTVESVGFMAAKTCPAGGCVPVCGDGCCEDSEKDDCDPDCGCTPVNGSWSDWVADGVCSGCFQDYVKNCNTHACMRWRGAVDISNILRPLNGVSDFKWD